MRIDTFRVNSISPIRSLVELLLADLAACGDYSVSFHESA
jgi:hypothetical protein